LTLTSVLHKGGERGTTTGRYDDHASAWWNGSARSSRGSRVMLERFRTTVAGDILTASGLAD
jgi:hypothetical protein